jgi:hypothetical protein
MAQTNMEGLQEELVKSTKSAYAFNKSTGQFEASTQDLYRLREQANIVGGDFEKMAEAGREAAKLEFIENAIDLSKVSEESKGLLAGLTTIQKGSGKIMVDVPGFDTQGKTLDEILKDTGKKAELDKALAEYQEKMKMDDKQLAVDQLTIAENQAIDIRTIKETIMKNLSPQERIDLEEKCFDWNLKITMLKNHPDLAFNIFKTNYYNNFLTKRGHFRNFNFPCSVLNLQKI